MEVKINREIRVIWAWNKSEILMPKHLCFGNDNLYVRIFMDASVRDRRKRRPARNKNS